MDHKKKFASFVKNLKKDDHITIIHDTDADGICSAVITDRALKKKGVTVERFIGARYDNFNETRLKALNDEGTNKLIIFDFAADQLAEVKKELDIFDAVLVVDHHKIYKDLNSKKITFIKAEYLKDLTGSDYCASQMVFDLFSTVVKIPELDWLAAIAMITDMTATKWTTFLNKVYKKYNTSYQELLNVGIVIDTGKQIQPPQVERILEVVLEAKNFQDILKSDFAKIAKKLQNEIEFWIAKFEERAEHRGTTWLYEIDPANSIGSVVSTLLSLKYPTDTIIITRRNKDMISINARNHKGKRAVNDLLERATKGMKGSNAGGHVPAAGGSIRQKDYAEFKKRIWKLA